MPSEATIQAEIMLTFGSTPGIRLWRANSGAARTPSGRVVRFGVPGQADISGIRLPSGQRVEIEVKSVRGRQSKQQRAFQAMIEKFGGIYVLARSVQDVESALSEKHAAPAQGQRDA